MLFDASNVYAPGEPRGDIPRGQYQNMSVLGRYHLDQLKLPNVWLGLAVIALLAYLVHKHGGRRK